MNDFTSFSPSELKFSLSENGILSLETGGERYDTVQLTRLFPFQYPDEYLSVSIQKDGERTELGIIRSSGKIHPAKDRTLHLTLPPP